MESRISCIHLELSTGLVSLNYRSTNAILVSSVIASLMFKFVDFNCKICEQCFDFDVLAVISSCNMVRSGWI
ncbi:hypothetical protein RJT34_16123 [Clitoria ternatea]|uniref:Uncharacterized protein n=1 Tax=Clitoria ternatea TaxID=43366 RepID=A0AAN9J6L9_CLITE